MKLSDAEWKAMRAVWRQPGGTVRDVIDALGPGTDWSYSTVKTLLARLAEKGVVRVDRDGHASRFTATISEREGRRSALAALLERVFDGTVGSLVHHLVAEEKLSKAELKTLRRLIDAPLAEPEAGGVKGKGRR